ncbi:MAG TPA: amino acid ABC transporter permease [Ramlibacter sp.]|nr:amino acid ABC transporter permease [Ramlibacter sp.]
MSWDWAVFCRNTSDGTVEATCWAKGADITYLEWMIHAWGWTLAVAVCAWFIAMIVGFGVGVTRTLPNSPIAARIANGWVELFRNIPILVQLFLWYFVVPKAFPVFQQVPGFLLVIFALGFFTSARIAEQVRAGVQALSRGQRYAGMAVGFTTWQTYRYVLLPMAFRIILPPLTSESMNLLKNSSVAFAVSIAELTWFATQAQEETSRGIEIYIGVTALYAASAFLVNRVFAFIERRMRIPGYIVACTGAGGH